MPVRKLILAIVAFMIFGGGQTVMSQLIYSNDFEDDPLGTYSVANLNADWNSPPFDNGVAEGRVSIVSDGSGKYLEVQYPEGLFGSGDDETGAQWKLEFGQGYEAVELEYRLKFGTGFDFVRGGKLPGLIGGEGNVGGNVPDGTDGFSARMMWRTDGSGGSPLTPDKANIVQYVYHPDQPGTFGQDFRWDDGTAGDWKEFESDRWYHLRHRVVMNTPGQNDGIIMAWLDGELVLNVNNIRFRDIASLQIDQMYFSTFFGGGSSIWATTKDEVAYFDDFTITEFVTTPPPTSQTVFDDSFADGDRAETNTGGENDTSWWTSSSSAADEITVGSLGLVTGSSGRGLHTVFPTQTLTNVGDKLTATYTFTTPATVANPGGLGAFRVGLFDTLGRAGLNADVGASSGTPNALYGWSVGNGGPGDPGLPGYMFDMDVNPTVAASADLNFRTHNVGSATGRLMQTTGSGSFSSISSGPDAGYTFAANTSYTGSFSIERTGLNELTLTGALGGDTYSIVDSDPDSFDFGFLGFHVNGGQFGSSNSAGPPFPNDNGIDFSNINVNFTAGIVLGDANDDGVITNDDILPFVQALTMPAAYAAAYPAVDPDIVLDMNGDGSFTNDDIIGFVTLLTTP